MAKNPFERPAHINPHTWEHNRVEDVKQLIWEREPLMVLDALIRNIRAGHYKGRMGANLVRTASEVFLAALDHERSSSRGTTQDFNERRFDEIDAIVSRNANEGFIEFGRFLRRVGEEIRKREANARSFPKVLVPGSDARIRRALLTYLEHTKAEAKESWPTLDSLIAELS